MKAIWKYKITGPDSTFDGPAGAIAISARMEEGGQPVLYLLCDRQTSKAKHQVQMFATGANVPEDAGSFVGTIILAGPSGDFVCHIFHRQLGVIV